MIRFTKQYHAANCGAVVVFNFQKWIGMPGDYKKDILDLERACGVDRETGSGPYDIMKGFRKLHGKDYSIKMHTIDDLYFPAFHIFTGNAIILNHRVSYRGRHWSLLLPCEGNKRFSHFRWINSFALDFAGQKSKLRTPKVMEVTPEKFEELVMRKTTFGDLPTVGLFIKEKR